MATIASDAPELVGLTPLVKLNRAVGDATTLADTSVMDLSKAGLSVGSDD